MEALKDNPKTCEEIVKRFLVGDIGEYRLATWMPEKQGDLEHVYVVTREEGEWRITHHALRPWRTASGAEGYISYSPKREDYRSDAWDKATYTLAEFVEVVNKDRRACNKRIAELRASSKHYAGCADYPML